MGGSECVCRQEEGGLERIEGDRGGSLDDQSIEPSIFYEEERFIFTA